MRDGKLTVPIAGDPPDGWNDAFYSTATLLGARDFEHVELKKGTARVEGVTPGSEERVRHFLESVVQQANSARHSSADEDEDHVEDRESGRGEESSDTQMTKRFRSFAAEHGREQ